MIFFHHHRRSFARIFNTSIIYSTYLPFLQIDDVSCLNMFFQFNDFSATLIHVCEHPFANKLKASLQDNKKLNCNIKNAVILVINNRKVWKKSQESQRT